MLACFCLLQIYWGFVLCFIILGLLKFRIGLCRIVMVWWWNLTLNLCEKLCCRIVLPCWHMNNHRSPGWGISSRSHSERSWLIPSMQWYYLRIPMWKIHRIACIHIWRDYSDKWPLATWRGDPWMVIKVERSICAANLTVVIRVSVSSHCSYIQLIISWTAAEIVRLFIYLVEDTTPSPPWFAIMILPLED